MRLFLLFDAQLLPFYVLFAWIAAVWWFAPVRYRNALLSLGLLCLAVIKGVDFLIVLCGVLFVGFVIEACVSTYPRGGQRPAQ
jgi:hypothetical protein